MIESLATYIPQDRRRALAQGRGLPEQTSGAALLADISGFSRLTEALAHHLGERRGAEELSRQLNQIYDNLLAATDNYGGSVISFAGDGMICWFDAHNDQPGNSAARRAVCCALAMQAALPTQTAVPQLTPERQTKLGMTATITSGAARRLLVGDPRLQLLDTLAGPPLTRLERGKRLTRSGELLVDEATAAALGDKVDLVEWRQDNRTAARFARVGGCRQPAAPQPWPPFDDAPLTLEQIRPWLLTAVYEQESAGLSQFLTELRPAVALFLRFTGLSYETESQTTGGLNEFVSLAQNELNEYGGALLQLNIGDKGSYLYAAFGAPIAHEDDSERAASAALALHEMAAAFGLPPLEIGLSRGVMRAGAYGGQSRRTYGVLGDDVNAAARLMELAEPGQTLVNERIRARLAGMFHFTPQPQPAGSELSGVYLLAGRRRQTRARLQETRDALPMIGRENERAIIAQKMESARQGQGQIVGVIAEAGMGKSRLAAEAIRLARRRNMPVFSGESQSYGVNTPYLVWQPIWQAFFNLDPAAPHSEQIEILQTAVAQLAPERQEALPLLGAALGLPIPPTPFTQALDPQSRKSALEMLWLDCLRGAAQQARAEKTALLFTLDDLHWIDPISHDLLELTAKVMSDWPLLLLLAYRPSDLARLQALRVENLPHFTLIALEEFTLEEASQFIQLKLAQRSAERPFAPDPPFIHALIERSQGNPFYIEELLNYLRDQTDVPNGQTNLQELPASLHSLILSRVDQLSERQKMVLKVASVMGRTFRFNWLCGYYPAVGGHEEALRCLEVLARLDLTPVDRPEPELTYMFKHSITQEATYESLTYANRAALHERLADYIEALDADLHLDLLAYHYERSENQAKKRFYLQKAGESAAAHFANAEAIDYFTRTLALIEPDDWAALYDLRLQRERLYDLRGDRPAQQADLTALAELAGRLADKGKLAEIRLRQARCAEVVGDYASSQSMATEAAAIAQETGDEAREAAARLQQGRVVIRLGQYETAADWLNQALQLATAADEPNIQANCYRNLGTVAWAHGDYAQAQRHYEQAVNLNRAVGNRRDESAMLNNLGVVALSQSAYEQACAYYEAALQLLRQIGDRHTEAVVLGNLGLVTLFQGQFDSTAHYQEQSMRLRREIADSFGENLARMNLGALALYQGQYAEAERLLRQVWDYYRAAGDTQEEAGALIYLGLLRCWQAEYEAALPLCEQALALARGRGLRSEEAMALNHLGHAAAGLGDWARATAVYREALAIFTDIGQLNYAQESQAGQAAVALGQGDVAAAQRCAEAILAYLAEANLDGAYDPMQVYLVCYETLRAANDSRWREVLQTAANLMQTRAANIADETRREGYLTAVPANRQLQTALRREE
jgi:class 3 adenylate cyclase/tetratricopeptide (TPR) repeat protein